MKANHKWLEGISVYSFATKNHTRTQKQVLCHIEKNPGQITKLLIQFYYHINNKITKYTGASTRISVNTLST